MTLPSFFIVALTYLTIGFAAAIFIFYILKRNVPGKFIGALVVGFIGSFLGGFVYQSFSDIFNSLADFNDVNIYAAVFTSILLIWFLSKLSSS